MSHMSDIYDSMGKFFVVFIFRKVAFIFETVAKSCIYFWKSCKLFKKAKKAHCFKKVINTYVQGVFFILKILFQTKKNDSFVAIIISILIKTHAEELYNFIRHFLTLLSEEFLSFASSCLTIENRLSTLTDVAVHWLA